ncbi:hypothetical protein ALC56_12361 [Trachymyrmex septentrionalis]|uniref:Uncharacterized protein n=1 Tax=Trachymyrmex septentrionalis TaxID=34720 RepID=A0A195F0K7_9HYME|nr:hypothetical protein ALC56_12361 [Trachymyrmex septentrionalis]
MYYDFYDDSILLHTPFLFLLSSVVDIPGTVDIQASSRDIEDGNNNNDDDDDDDDAEDYYDDDDDDDDDNDDDDANADADADADDGDEEDEDDSSACKRITLRGRTKTANPVILFQTRRRTAASRKESKRSTTSN